MQTMKNIIKKFEEENGGKPQVIIGAMAYTIDRQQKQIEALEQRIAELSRRTDSIERSTTWKRRG